MGELDRGHWRGVVDVNLTSVVYAIEVFLPFMRNAQLDNAALERASRQVDIKVDRPMGESYTGHDAQLERAVQELLNQLRSSRARAGSGDR